MKRNLWALLAGFFVCGALSIHAQAPGAAPAGSTGLCNDGTYTNAASKSGACRGHKGVKTWMAASTAASAAAAPSVPAARAAAPSIPAQTASPQAAAARAAAPTAPAAGGGNGQVWLNTGDKVYHCQGDRYYGKTKAGAYMSESDAVAKGGKPAYGKTCSK